MRDPKTLSVRLYGEPVGELAQTSTGKMRFTYLPNANHLLSLGMPMQAAPFDEEQTEAYFGGLLPESELARQAIGLRYGINHRNSFALLQAIGYDCAGAVSLHSSTDSTLMEGGTSFPLVGRILPEQELYQHILDLPKKPLFLGVEGLRLSLAGAQDKAAVCLIDNEIALPENGCPTTHILKPVIPGFEGIVHNEYLCLKLATRVGLTVPHSEIRWANDIPYLLIQRYDRRVQHPPEGAKVFRLHQEDFCQALGVNSALKYQNQGGPDFKACFNLLRNTTQPVKDRNTLAALMVFNYLMGNMDAHGKNFSLLHHPGTHQTTEALSLPSVETVITFAPVYDVICTRVYDQLAHKMAMKIGGYYEPDKILPRRWERECKDVGYAYPALRDMIRQQAHTLLTAMPDEREALQQSGLFHPMVDGMLTFLENHIHQTLKRFE